MNLRTVKWSQCDKTQSENCNNYSSKCAYDSAQLRYTIQQRTLSSDNLPSYLQTNIIAQMLAIGGDGVQNSQNTDNMKERSKLYSNLCHIYHYQAGICSYLPNVSNGT